MQGLFFTIVCARHGFFDSCMVFGSFVDRCHWRDPFYSYRMQFYAESSNQYGNRIFKSVQNL